MPVDTGDHLGVSENRGPKYSTLNGRILIKRTPNKVTLIFGNYHFFDSVSPCDLTSLHPSPCPLYSPKPLDPKLRSPDNSCPIPKPQTPLVGSVESRRRIHFEGSLCGFRPMRDVGFSAQCL